VLCLIVVPLPPGENPFAVKINIYLYLKGRGRGIFETLHLKANCLAILSSSYYLGRSRNWPPYIIPIFKVGPIISDLGTPGILQGFVSYVSIHGSWEVVLCILFQCSERLEAELL
jgi:hypothetical protein